MTNLQLVCNIEELNRLPEIEHLEQKYLKEFRSSPINLSYWNPSSEFKRTLLEHLHLPSGYDIIDYIYSYELETEKKSSVKRLGFDPTEFCGIFTPSGTVSSLLVCLALKKLRVSKVVVLTPTYFCIMHHLDVLEIPFIKKPMLRQSKRYHLPDASDIFEALESKTDNVALWITNPVFATGCYVGVSEASDLINRISRHRPHTLFVFDEALALSGMELGPRLKGKENSIFICSPHKSISINTLKFSSIICSEETASIIEDWAEIVYGGLAMSNILAIRHYLSDNFEVLVKIATGFFDRKRTEVEGLVSKSEFAEMDEGTSGYFVSLYYPSLDSDFYLRREDAAWNLTKNSGSVLITGPRNSFSDDSGFSFRINLAMMSAQSMGSLSRAISHLDSQVSRRKRRVSHKSTSRGC